MSFEEDATKRLNAVETKVADLATKVSTAIDKEADKGVDAAANWIKASKWTAGIVFIIGAVFLFFVYK